MIELTGRQVELFRNLRTIEAAVKAGYKLPPDDSGHWPNRGFPDKADPVATPGEAVVDPAILALAEPVQPPIAVGATRSHWAADPATAAPGVPGTIYPSHVDPPAPQPGAA